MNSSRPELRGVLPVFQTPWLDDETLDLDTLERVTAAAFGQRRKMLRSALKSLTPDAEALLREAGLEPTARAEEIDQAGFRALADAWRARG